MSLDEGTVAAKSYGSPLKRHTFDWYGASLSSPHSRSDPKPTATEVGGLVNEADALYLGSMMSRPFPNRIFMDGEEHRKHFLIAFSQPTLPSGALPNEGCRVVLDAVIGRDGLVKELSIREGDPELAHRALDTVQHWAYRPTTLNGIPVEVATQIEVIFA